ncbi:MAG: sigma factor SigB regulation protein RsbQ [Pseudomonadota bacterium]
MDVKRLVRDDGETIAYLTRDGRSPGVVWLGGFHSDMAGTKAEALDGWAAEKGRAFLRFDYFGHGQSSGAFRDGTITRWRDDALAVIDTLCGGPQILVGSSMGGWIALLAALARPEKVKGLLLLAPAPDFTETLMWDIMPVDIRNEILHRGEWMRPSEYEAPYPITRALIEDGRKHLLLGGAIPVTCPVRILQGMKDPDVPWEHAVRLAEHLDGNPVLTLVKQGDHRLSTPDDITRLKETLEGLLSGL